MGVSITYRQLYKKLGQLGYTHQSLVVAGKPCEAFEHPTIPSALILLPPTNPDDQVEQFHMISVLAALKANDLLPEYNPLAT
jgi:hypothetical protein